MLVLRSSSLMPPDSYPVEDVDQLSRMRWSHNHHTHPDSDVSLSLQDKLDALDNRMRYLDNRFDYAVTRITFIVRRSIASAVFLSVRLSHAYFTTNEKPTASILISQERQSLFF